MWRDLVLDPGRGWNGGGFGLPSCILGSTVDGSEIRRFHQLRLVVYPI